jgi:hypothetical protein
MFGSVAILPAPAVVVGAAGSAFSDSSRLPASDSSTAYNLLADHGSDASKKLAKAAGSDQLDVKVGGAAFIARSRAAT